MCHIDEPHPTDLLMLLAYTVLSASFSCSSFKSLVFHVKHSHKVCRGINLVQPIRLCRFCLLMSFFSRCFPAYPVTALCFTWNVSVDEPHLTSLLMLLAYTVLPASFSCSPFKSLVFHVKHPHKACRIISLAQPIRLCRFCLLMSFLSRCSPAYSAIVICST